MSKRGIRLAFKYGDWQPTESQWLYGGRCVQKEEQDRASNFVFKKDSKAAMVGRLLIRKAIQELLGISYRDITLSRTHKGKPYLTNSTHHIAPNFSFNMTHQGDYAIVAAEMDCLVGVDTMKIEWPTQRSVDQFFHSMRRQLTDNEWAAIDSAATEWGRVQRFYRHWCLKESYIKALGVGLGYSLKRLNFQISNLDPQLDELTTDTTVQIDGVTSSQWHFEEQICGEDHLVAVAMRSTIHSPDHESENYLVIDYLPNSSTKLTPDSIPARVCEIISWHDLIKDSQPISSVDPSFWAHFESKKEKPQLLEQKAVLPD